MRSYLAPALILFITLFSGCGSKKYFEPTDTSTVPSSAISSHSGKATYLTRDGVTFNNDKYVSRYGAGELVLKINEVYLSENKKYLMTSDQYGTLFIRDKKSRKIIKTVKFDVPIVSVGLKDGLLVYLLQDNTFGIYKLSTDTKLVENKAEDAFAVDSRIASPMFIDNLAVVPTLDGKLLIMDMYNPDNAKVIYISSSSRLNNVIYLSRVGNLLVTATPNRVMTIGTADGEFSQGISEVAISKGAIYLFTKAGEIIKMDSSLKRLAYKKFKFAHFSTGTAFGGRVYALDQKGSLIVADKNLKKSHIYDIGEVKDFAFISGHRMYKDNIIISLDKLSL
jgi:hypothetical protein